MSVSSRRQAANDVILRTASGSLSATPQPGVGYRGRGSAGSGPAAASWRAVARHTHGARPFTSAESAHVTDAVAAPVPRGVSGTGGGGRLPLRDLESACGGCSPAPFREAVTTVDRTVASGPERNGSVLAAVSAYDGMHLASACIVTTTAAAVSAATTAVASASATALAVALLASPFTARRAALRLVRIALLGVVSLVVGAEDEGLAALYTCEASVCVGCQTRVSFR